MLRGWKILNRLLDPDHAPVRDDFSSVAVVNLCTKFEVSRCTRYEAVNGGTKCRKCGGRGHSRSWSVSPFDLLFNSNRNYAAFSYHFRDMASYLSKVIDFNLLYLHLTPPVEFLYYLWRHKTRVPRLLCGVYVILCSAISVEHRLVTDRHRPIAYTALA